MRIKRRLVIHQWEWLDKNSAPKKTKMCQNSVLVQTHCFYLNMLALCLLYSVNSDVIGLRYIQCERCSVLNVFCKAFCICKMIRRILNFYITDRIYSLVHSDDVSTHTSQCHLPSFRRKVRSSCVQDQ